MSTSVPTGPDTPRYVGARRDSFEGFPRGARAIAIPELFFAALLPAIADPAELVVTLYAFYALSRKRGYPAFLRRGDLLADGVLARALARLGDPKGHPEEALSRGLALALQRGSLISLPVGRDGPVEELYFLNTPAHQRARELVRAGAVGAGLGPPLPGPVAEVEAHGHAPLPPTPNIFALYEDNIGPITPLIAEELLAAEERYPWGWIEAAIRLAVSRNKRNWRYTQGILRRWAVEGPDYEEAGRDPEGAAGQRPLSGKYRRLVRR